MHPDRITFTYEQNDGSSTGYTDRVIENEAISLDEVASAFTWFLRSAGFDYVEGVSINTGDGDEVVFTI